MQEQKTAVVSVDFNPPIDIPLRAAEEMRSLGRRTKLVCGASIRAEDISHAVYYVLSGYLKVVVQVDDEHSHIIGIHGPGTLVGFVSLLDGLPNWYDSVAQTDVELLAIPRSRLNRWIMEEESRRELAIRILCERVRSVTSISMDYAVNPRRRLARRLLRVANAIGRNSGNKAVMDIRFSQEDWAAMAGVSRQTLNGLFASFRRDNIIRLDRGLIVIDDMSLLHQIAMGEESSVPVRRQFDSPVI
jgi:CRP/FNR family cyclic AMP-dependent transcriptional regulator